jgi:hypothetical protein
MEAQQVTDPSIIEAARRAIESYYDNLPPSAKAFVNRRALQVVVAAVTPLIRRHEGGGGESSGGN